MSDANQTKQNDIQAGLICSPHRHDCDCDDFTHMQMCKSKRSLSLSLSCRRRHPLKTGGQGCFSQRVLSGPALLQWLTSGCLSLSVPRPARPVAPVPPKKSCLLPQRCPSLRCNSCPPKKGLESKQSFPPLPYHQPVAPPYLRPPLNFILFLYTPKRPYAGTCDDNSLLIPSSFLSS